MATNLAKVVDRQEADDDSDGEEEPGESRSDEEAREFWSGQGICHLALRSAYMPMAGIVAIKWTPL